MLEKIIFSPSERILALSDEVLIVALQAMEVAKDAVLHPERHSMQDLTTAQNRLHHYTELIQELQAAQKGRCVIA